MDKDKRDPLTERIISCAYKVHRQIGAGFQEKIYHNAFKVALQEENLIFDYEKMCEVEYHNKKVGKFKLDLLVEGKIVVEVKAVEGNMPRLFESQLLSYLKVTGLEVGLLINFGNDNCRVRRIIRKSL